jgi:hypothetical protein
MEKAGGQGTMPHAGHSYETRALFTISLALLLMHASHAIVACSFAMPLLLASFG